MFGIWRFILLVSDHYRTWLPLVGTDHSIYEQPLWRCSPASDVMRESGKLSAAHKYCSYTLLMELKCHKIYFKTIIMFSLQLLDAFWDLDINYMLIKNHFLSIMYLIIFKLNEIFEETHFWSFKNYLQRATFNFSFYPFIVKCCIQHSKAPRNRYTM